MRDDRRSSMSLIIFGRLALVLGVACLLTAPAAAEDAADKKKDPPITVPTFSVENIAPQEKDLLDGWLVLDDDASDGQPSEASISPVIEGAGLTEDDVYVHPFVVKTPAGAKVAAAMIDNDAADPAKFNAALKAKAAAAGWAMRELGTPKRLVVVGGEATVRDQVMEELVAHVVYEFSALARDRINIQKSWDKEETKRATRQCKGFIMAGRALVPNAGTLTAIESFFTLRKHHAKKGEAASAKKKDDSDKMKAANKAALKLGDEFVAMAKKAVAKDTPLRPRGNLITSVSRQAGSLLLQRKSKAVLDDAVYFLELASDSEPRDHSESFSIRYDLACAYARQGRKDDAFAMLRKSLDVGVLLPWRNYGPSFIHMEKKDSDMSTLRSDDRWDAIIKDFRNDSVTKYEKHKKEQEDRQKREKERRKNGESAPDEDKDDEDHDG